MFTRLAVVASLGALLVTARVAAAQSGGGVLTFAILGGPAVTCTSSTTSGDIGVATTTAFTNTGCSISGNIHAGDCPPRRRTMTTSTRTTTSRRRRAAARC